MYLHATRGNCASKSITERLRFWSFRSATNGASGFVIMSDSHRPCAPSVFSRFDGDLTGHTDDFALMRHREIVHESHSNLAGGTFYRSNATPGQRSLRFLTTLRGIRGFGSVATYLPIRNCAALKYWEEISFSNNHPPVSSAV